PEDTSPDPIDSDHPPAAMVEPAVVEGPETAIPDPTTPSKPSAWQFSWERLVGIVWLAGSLAWMMVAWIRIVRFRRILRFALPANGEVQFRVQQLAGRLGLSVCPSISFVAAPIAPLLWGLARSPRLLIPSQLWERLTEG